MYQIILVDDEILIREAISKNMNWDSIGCELAGSFQNGQEALEFIKTHPVDIVLTDICMPYMDGLELSRNISEEYPSVQVVILSGYDNFDYAKKAMKYKVEDYLLKPVTAMELKEVLQKLITRLEKEKKDEEAVLRMRETYHKNRLFLRGKTMMNFILGENRSENMEKELIQYDIHFESAAYSMALLELELDEEGSQESSLMSFVVYNITEEILAEFQIGQAFVKENNQVVVLIATNQPRTIKDKLEQIFMRIQEQVYQIIGLILNVGVGSFVPEPSLLQKSYQEAMEALLYKYILGRGTVIQYEVLSFEKEEPDLEEIEKRLYEELKANHMDQVKKQLDAIREELKEALVNRERAFFCLKVIINGIKGILELTELKNSQVYQKAQYFIDAVSTAPDLNEAVAAVENYANEAGMEIENQKDGRAKQRAMLALNYIEKNYMDSSLNLQSICDYLAMSTSRFSAMFKEFTGTTFMEALIKVRMERAKELIANTDLKNYEIAEKVGFSDPHYFGISFKKAVGMTPKEYARERRG